MPQKRNPYALAAIRAQAGPGRRRRDRRADGDAHRLGAHRPLPPPQRPRAARARGGRRGRAAGRRRARRACASTPSAWRARRARASRTPPTSPTCSRPRAAWTTARRTRSSAWRCGGCSRTGAGELTAEAVAAAALELTGTAVAVDPAQLDPAACAQARLQEGSSSRAAMDAMLAEVDASRRASAPGRATRWPPPRRPRGACSSARQRSPPADVTKR